MNKSIIHNGVCRAAPGKASVSANHHYWKVSMFHSIFQINFTLFCKATKYMVEQLLGCHENKCVSGMRRTLLYFAFITDQQISVNKKGF